MVWSGYAVLMSGKTNSIKLNNNPDRYRYKIRTGGSWVWLLWVVRCCGSAGLVIPLSDSKYLIRKNHEPSRQSPSAAQSMPYESHVHLPLIWPSTMTWSWQQLVVVVVTIRVLDQPDYPHQQ
ncbi:hypothetical protein Tco_1373103 [Tanacetum coccineum]